MAGSQYSEVWVSGDSGLRSVSRQAARLTGFGNETQKMADHLWLGD